jgi:hypothetical protein
MERAASLRQYVGGNEKTLVKVALSASNSAPPSRAPTVDAQTKQAMVAHWHKRERAAAALEADCAASQAGAYAHADAEWANPNALKQQISGLGRGGIRFKAQ